MIRHFWISRTLAAGIVSVAAYGYVAGVSAIAGDDGRTPIVLSVGERNAILTEMRGFLESVRVITSGLAEKDNKAVATGARRSGMASTHAMPSTLMGKLPPEFRKLGMATHMAFDELSREAQDIGDGQVMLKTLGELMRNCTACHAGYRIDVDGSKNK